MNGYAASYGADIRAVASGTVVGSSDNWGKLTIQSPSGVNYIYGHLSQINFKAGDQVQAGTVIGRVGNTGGVPTHLHYEVTKKDFSGGSLVGVSNWSTLGKQHFRDRTFNPLKNYWQIQWYGS